jgi:hypothetical protein
MAGDLRHVLPSNIGLLGNPSKAVNKRYYALSSKNQEKALSEGLKRANEFLSQEVKNENVSWLGNLNFGALSIKDSDLSFTKTGELKILLFRAGQIINIGQRLDNQEIDPYPLKIFFNIVSGKLTLNDVIMVLTKEVFSFLEKKNIFSKIAAAGDINHKKIKELFPPKLFTEGDGANISGLCFLLVVDQQKPRKFKTILFKARGKFIKLHSILPKFKFLKKLIKKVKSIKIKKPTLHLNRPRKTKANFLKIPNFFQKVNFYRAKVPALKKLWHEIFTFSPKKIKNKVFSYFSGLSFEKIKSDKNFILIASLIIFILIGFLLFSFWG